MTNTPPPNLPMLKVLLLEDNISLAEEMIAFLSANDMLVSHCTTLHQLYSLLEQSTFSLLILDRLLPEGDSLTQLEQVKHLHSGCIIVLSALGMSSDRITGLNAGADYYLSKPVDLDELLAVSKAVRRKNNTAQMPKEWCLSEERKTINTPSGHEVALTGSEFNLIKTLIHHANTILKREMIIEKLGLDLEHYDVRRLDTLVCRLRAKLRNEAAEDIPIHTFSKVGYAWKGNATEHNESQ